MAYGEGGESARLLLSTLRNTADFAGRSRRTEVVVYWVAVTLIGAMIGLATSEVFPWGKDILAFGIARIPLAVPGFALFARRLHDQGRSGWWSLLLVASVIVSVPDFLQRTQNDPMQLIAYEQAGPHPLHWLSALISIAVLALSLWPGTIGSNRFGPDPRETE